MGQLHFEQMLATAVQTDCRAYPLALHLKWATNTRWPEDGPAMGSVPFETVMATARQLAEVWLDYLRGLKELHAADRIRVYGRELVTGRVLPIPDVEILNDDSDVMRPEAFYAHLLNTDLTQ